MGGAVVWCGGMVWAQGSPVDWVNVRIGTGSGPIGYGGSMPFVAPPFGMTDWTAQTRQNKLSVVSYKYDDTKISGFMGTHQPAIWMGDYGYVTLMPEVDGAEDGAGGAGDGVSSMRMRWRGRIITR